MPLCTFVVVLLFCSLVGATSHNDTNVTKLVEPRNHRQFVANTLQEAVLHFPFLLQDDVKKTPSIIILENPVHLFYQNNATVMSGAMDAFAEWDDCQDDPSCWACVLRIAQLFNSSFGVHCSTPKFSNQPKTCDHGITWPSDQMVATIRKFNLPCSKNPQTPRQEQDMDIMDMNSKIVVKPTEKVHLRTRRAANVEEDGSLPVSIRSVGRGEPVRRANGKLSEHVSLCTKHWTWTVLNRTEFKPIYLNEVTCSKTDNSCMGDGECVPVIRYMNVQVSLLGSNPPGELVNKELPHSIDCACKAKIGSRFASEIQHNRLPLPNCAAAIP